MWLQMWILFSESDEAAGFLTGIISFSRPEPEECGYYGIVINPTEGFPVSGVQQR